MNGANGFSGLLQFNENGAFTGSIAAPRSEARLLEVGGTPTLQNDVDGNGIMGGQDFEKKLVAQTGLIASSYFSILL